MEASSFPASRCSSTCAACSALPCSHNAMSAAFSSLQVSLQPHDTPPLYQWTFAKNYNELIKHRPSWLADM